MVSFPKHKIKVLLLENVHSNAISLFANDGFSVETQKGAYSEEDLLAVIEDIHILGIRSKTQISKKVLEKAGKLLSIGCFCIGTNQVELSEAQLRGIPVFNAPYSNTRSVAELVIAEIIMLSRKAGDLSMECHGKRWSKISSGCHEIRGKVLGIVGYGHIGSQVSIMAEALGMKVIYYDILSKLPLGNAGVCQSFEELLEKSNFVTLHVPENPDTLNMVTKKELDTMKQGSYLLNLSRGRVVDLDALKEALRSGHIAGAAVDVFPEEPKNNGDLFETPLQNLPNVILTPHIGGSTEEAQANIGTEVADKLIKFVNNGSTSTSVNFPNVELPLLRDNYRVLNVHKNQPGFLRDINHVVSDVGANINAQYLSTLGEIGYLIMDVNKDLGDKVKEAISQHSFSIKTRILY
ncbi:MAG: phosphoglycerate dehydrogenase [Leptospiraceae bacterium]|nr:phosphoglycerate dehydrogenase [Leptospiraceae bacterium]